MVSILFLFIGFTTILLGYFSEAIMLLINNLSFINISNLEIIQSILMLILFFVYSTKLEIFFISLYFNLELKFELMTLIQTILARITLSFIMLIFYNLVVLLQQKIPDLILSILIIVPILNLFGIATKNWFDSIFNVHIEKLKTKNN